jgi:hypothetical protein
MFAAGGGPARRGRFLRDQRPTPDSNDFYPGQILIADDGTAWRNNGNGVGVDDQKWQAYGWGGGSGVAAVVHALDPLSDL